MVLPLRATRRLVEKRAEMVTAILGTAAIVRGTAVPTATKAMAIPATPETEILVAGGKAMVRAIAARAPAMAVPTAIKVAATAMAIPATPETGILVAGGRAMDKVVTAKPMERAATATVIPATGIMAMAMAMAMVDDLWRDASQYFWD